MAESADVFVIIPFFQRLPGLLSRAIASVSAQGMGARCHIIVVDDGSPYSAEDDLRGISAAERANITLICQANGGAGAARNAALNAVPPHASVVAFLDSDDTWSSDHLSRALAAIEEGADLYFAKVAEIEDDGPPPDGFWPGSTETKSTLVLPETVALNDSFLVYAIRRGLPLQTLVVRAELCRSVRFATHLHRAGEDLMFTFALSRSARLCVFSAQVEAQMGRGVNIYRSTLAHGSPEAVPRLLDEVQSRLELGKVVRGMPALVRENTKMYALTLSGLSVQMLHAVRRLRIRSLLLIASYVARTPRVAGPLVWEALRACVARLRSPS